MESKSNMVKKICKEEVEVPLFSIEAKCQTLTPMIMSGANKESFELREPSIKGLLRFWWRAFAGIQDTATLFQREAELFGSTEKASAFRVTISDANPTITQPGHTPQNVGWGNGIQYLLFSILELNSQNHTYYTRRSFAQAGLQFTLKLSGFKEESQVKEILKALWLASILGGLGSRSRRGAGSFEVTNLKIYKKGWEKDRILVEIEGAPDFFCFKNKNSLEEIKRAFLQELKKVLPRPIPQGLPDFTVFSKDQSSFYLFSGSLPTSTIDLWNTLGARIKEERKIKPQEDAQALHNYADKIKGVTTPGAPPGVWQKHAFGLPIIYNFKEDFGNIHSQNLGITLKASVYEISREKQITETRRASPLFISIHSNHNGKYFAILSLLWSQFIDPNNYQLKWEWLRGRENEDLGSGHIPDDPRFIRQVLKNIGAIPV